LGKGEFVCCSKVIETLKKVNVRTASGAGKINNYMLKNLSYSFLYLLTLIINLSLSHSTLSLSWKEATLTVIPKKEEHPSDPTKYRPISLTICVRKVIERVIG
jgi:hypothetical protein